MKVACNNISLEFVNADKPNCLTCALYRKWDICMKLLYSKDCHLRYVDTHLAEIFKI